MGSGAASKRRNSDSHETRWCLCMENKMACYFVAVVILIGSLVAFGIGITLLIFASAPYAPPEISLNASGSILIIMGFFDFIATVFLFVGLTSEEPEKLTPMVMCLGASVVMLLAVLLIMFSFMPLEEIEVTFTLIFMCVILVVLFCQHIVRDYRNSLSETTFVRELESGNGRY